MRRDIAMHGIRDAAPNAGCTVVTWAEDRRARAAHRLRPPVHAFLLAVIGAWLAVQGAAAAPADDGAAPLWSRAEARLGGFVHAVPLGKGQEYGGVDLAGEVLLPRVPLLQDSAWALLMPRPDAGFVANFSHKTSYGYVGAAWTVTLDDRWFVEPGAGVAFHNGRLSAAPGEDRLSLGCNPVARLGVSAGYRLNRRWALLASIDHLSNGGFCDSNRSLNEVGTRLSFAF